MKKKLTYLLTVLLVLVMVVGCSKPAPTDPDANANRTYDAFALAAGLTPVFDGYANYHSDNIVPFGEGTSTNYIRFKDAKNDELILAMRAADPTTDEGRAEYQKLYREWVQLMNEELPVIPMYSNEYYDGYDQVKLPGFKTGTMYGWDHAIVDVKPTVDTIQIGMVEFNGQFMQGWGNSSYDDAIRDLVFDKLLTTNFDGEMVVGGIVDSLETSADQKEWTFKLKSGLKFSDGSPLTTEDVLFTYLFYSDPSFTEAGASASYNPKELVGYQAYVDSAKAGTPDVSKFTGIEVISDTEIKFTVETPIFSTWSKLFTFGIFPKAIYAPDGKIDVKAISAKYLAAPVGSGPFILEEYKPNEFVRLTANPNYAGNQDGNKPSFTTLIAKVVDDATDYERLIAGDIDILSGMIEYKKMTAIKDSGKEINAYKRHGYGYLAFHTDFGVGSHKEIRQALAYSLDRVVFGQDMIGPNATVVQGPYATTYWMIDDAWVNSTLTNYTKDTTMAQKVLTDAGWKKGSDGIFEKDGLKAEIRIAVAAKSWESTFNKVLSNIVAESGISVKVSLIDFNVLQEHFYGSFKG